MPTSVRKSSIGTARRAVQKAHIPYRGDNTQVGKKTGLAVQNVNRRSDGFEPFEELLNQADKRGPPKLSQKQNKNKKLLREPIPDDDDDELGEQSMVMDDSPIPSYRTRLPLTSISRPKPRISLHEPNIDLDEIPSPRPLSIKPRISSVSDRLSKLSQSSGPQLGSPDRNSDEMRIDQDSPVHQTSFTQMDVVDEADQEVPAAPFSREDKGKGRMEAVEEEPELEDLNDDNQVKEGPESDVENEPPAKEPSPTKPKKSKPKPKPRVKPSRSRRDSTPPADGLRRGKRHRYRPLEWWRQEKVVYGKPDDEDGQVFVAPIKEIIRIPKEVPVPLGKKGRSARRKPSSRAKSETAELAVYNPEEGWDNDTPDHAVVIDYGTGEDIDRRIAVTAANIKLRGVSNNEWFFQKVIGDGDFIAAGELMIPPRSRKPSKMSKDNTYIFYVIEGAVNLKIHHTSLLLATGAIFLVPRGNTYFIENVSERDAKLFFSQARKITESEDDQRISAGPRRSTSTSAGPRQSTERAK